jgi:hypothetical protein
LSIKLSTINFFDRLYISYSYEQLKFLFKNYCQSIYLIADKLFIDNKIILIENSIKIIDNYLLSIKLVINNQEKSLKTRFYRQLLINNRLKKLCY